MANIHFVLGGARSGKTSYCEQLAQKTAAEFGVQAVYIATSDRLKSSADPEMQARIARHQSDRATQNWQNIETPISLAAELSALNENHRVVMIDCMTLWLLNLMEADCLEFEKSAFLAQLNLWKGELFIVSNEIGMGVVPIDKLSRQFVDELGWLHQDIAKIAHQVTLMVAGIPSKIK